MLNITEAEKKDFFDRIRKIMQKVFDKELNGDKKDYEKINEDRGHVFSTEVALVKY